MERVLILGAEGMLGNCLHGYLQKEYEVHGTIRSKALDISYLNSRKISCGIDAQNDHSVLATIDKVQPKVVVNCIGIVKQRVAPIEEMIVINSLFPHRLARYCADHGIYCIHISTDCVFSGLRGNYAESDMPDPIDIYGRSKLLGEPEEHALTLRTSLVGIEVKRNHGLVSWFLQKSGKVPGYTKAIFSGLPCEELARVIRMVIERKNRIYGLCQDVERELDAASRLARLPCEPDGRRHPGGAGTKRRSGGPTARQSDSPCQQTGAISFGARYAALRGGALLPACQGCCRDCCKALIEGLQDVCSYAANAGAALEVLRAKLDLNYRIGRRLEGKNWPSMPEKNENNKSYRATQTI